MSGTALALQCIDFLQSSLLILFRRLGNINSLSLLFSFYNACKYTNVYIQLCLSWHRWEKNFPIHYSHLHLYHCCFHWIHLIFFRFITIQMQVTNNIIEFVDIWISIFVKEIFLIFIHVVFILSRRMLFSIFFLNCFLHKWKCTENNVSAMTSDTSFLFLYAKKNYVYRFFEQSNYFVCFCFNVLCD